jgi:adenosylcobinamide kinase / adenosylcobinamide-phosphate guanylyltransferase
MSLTLLLGGARSGKSSLAVEIGRRFDGPVTYVATAPVVDDDMADRIERHRDERPASWRTIEEEVDLDGAIRSVDEGLVIVDCVTLWTSNLMWREIDDDEIRRRAADAAATCAARSERVVVISNEVGLGVHPEAELGRRYRDLLGWVNQSFAAVADPALLLVAGKAVVLSDPWQTLDP